MSLWRDAATVVAGSATTVVLGGVALLSLPVLGFVTAEVLGTWVPTWVLAFPLTLSPVGGGALTGFLQRAGQTKCAFLGGVAATLGVFVVGAIVGLLALTVLLGMTPAGSGDPDLPRALLSIEALSGGLALLVGPTFGAVGGVGGHICRRHVGW